MLENSATYSASQPKRLCCHFHSFISWCIVVYLLRRDWSPLNMNFQLIKQHLWDFRVCDRCSLLVATEDVEFQVGPEGESFFGLKAGCVSHWQTATSHTPMGWLMIMNELVNTPVPPSQEVGGFKTGMDQTPLRGMHIYKSQWFQEHQKLTSGFSSTFDPTLLRGHLCTGLRGFLEDVFWDQFSGTARNHIARCGRLASYGSTGKGQTMANSEFITKVHKTHENSYYSTFRL